MPAPANDAQADAETVTVGPYWGVVAGTTVEATEDAGGPFDGYGVQEVWYTWSSLPAGQVFFYCKPDSPQFIEIAAWSCAPGDAADTADVIAWASGDDTEFFMCMGQGTHAGGPMTVAVITYVGDPGPIAFQFGWGHELDATASHWGDVQSEAPITRTPDVFSAKTPVRGVKQTYTAPVAGTTVPAGFLTCAYGNARDGVVDIPSSTSYGCSYIGPGTAGTTASGFNDRTGSAGQAYHTHSVPNIGGPTTTGRGDRVSVDQTAVVFRIEPDHTEPLTEDNSGPVTFSDYAYEPGRREDGFVWGFELEGGAWAITDAAFGTLTLTDPYSDTVTWDIDVVDPVTVTFRALPQSMVWPTAATWDGAANRVTILDNSGSPSHQVSYILPDDVPGDTIADLVDGANTVTLADPVSYLLQADDETAATWVVGLLIAEETLAGTEPTAGDPPRPGDYRAVGVRAVSFSGTPSYKTTYPDWRPYLGFPLVPPVLGGWHVGRAALSVSGPW